MNFDLILKVLIYSIATCFSSGKLYELAIRSRAPQTPILPVPRWMYVYTVYVYEENRADQNGAYLKIAPI